MHDIAVIGLGRVGLPLALSLEAAGFDVIGIDLNFEALNNAFESKVFPFKEPGYEELFKNSKIKVYSAQDYTIIPEVKTYIITVGTPLLQHIEADLSNVRSTVKLLIDNVNMTNKMIILRSTVAPKTTASLKTFIHTTSNYRVGENIFLAMCPERLAEGVALEELHKLPQIIGTEDPISKERAEAIFSRFGVEIKHVNYIEAELCKLFCNIYRYINFAIPNYFTYIANEYNANVYKVLDVMRYKYPRTNELKNPGLVCGSCLRKDFGMINQDFPQTDLILQAYKINEFMPKFYADLAGDKLTGKKIGILGYTMKKDTDDTRDALTPKLIRYIENYTPSHMFINEPNYKLGIINDERMNNFAFINLSIDDVIENSDIIFVAMNHSEYYNIDLNKLKGKLIIDIWNIYKKNLVFTA